ncbi:MAG: TOBE domain-containing protein [Ilumatobacteraceae bacterium]
MSRTAVARPARMRPAEPADARLEQVSIAELVCLTLVSQKVTHGWALGTMLAPDGEVGRIWTLSRPLTYRAIDGLVDKGFVVRTGQAAGRGRDRVILSPTPPGRRRARAWLDTPVAHLRDVRTELLVKLFLRERAGLDNTVLLAVQQERFEPAIDALTSTSRDDDLVDLWRRESARAVRRFLDQALRPPSGSGEARTPELQLSARNQLQATLTDVRHGEVMSTVKAVLDDSQGLTAAITKEAVADLDLAPGDPVVVIIKSTDVIVGKGLVPVDGSR